MKVVIIGAGGHGRVVLDILRKNHQFEIVGFLDSNPSLLHSFVDGVQVIGDLSMVSRFRQHDIGGAIVAIGDNKVRDKYATDLENLGISLVNAIHPSATIADNARIGKNVVIASGTNICTHVILEDSVICNTGCIIDHESVIRRAVHICPGVKIAGHVTVNEAAFIGIGATIIQGVTIGESVVAGAGTVILEDVPTFSTVVGVPARLTKTSHIPDLNQKIQASTADLEPVRSLVTRPVRIRPQPLASGPKS
ncbi:MAG: acetyltransferase [Phycisphaerae bacterium]|nr:acetyltransferase [Phycisphaerae bacterium]